jgi:hypothetical protein
MSFYIRVWQPCDIEGITQHLLIVGDIAADCAACRELGLEWIKTKVCPKCGTPFHFIASRNTSRLDRNRGVNIKRIKEQRPDLTFIDYEDYKEIMGKKQAREFFK